jgi:hypothetical protein
MKAEDVRRFVSRDWWARIGSEFDSGPAELLRDVAAALGQSDLLVAFDRQRGREP